ncbi:MAG: DUF4112 domain-containing protein [Nostocaceae cyanobacterium]|nr:DUF4112 domain-containing protein [Nostocaceae cyanobacterium]
MSQLPSGVPALPGDSKAASLQRLRTLTRLLDNVVAVPGTPVAIGLDPLIGMIPGIGDFLGVGISAYIVLEAARLGVPKATLSKMVFNILLDGFVGILPFIGDVFDFTWKANTRNLKLVEAHLASPHRSERINKGFLIAILAGICIFGIGLVALGVVLMRLLFAGLAR